MRAVWSFWSAPYEGYAGPVWGSQANHLLAWALSFEAARRHHRETMLVTDSEGAALLVEGLGLEFGMVSLALDGLGDVDPDWWTAGKLAAVALQDRPFVHLDADVFLWRALPERLRRGAVLSQNPEAFGPDHDWYRPDAFETGVGGRGGWLPATWAWPEGARTAPRGECCGIVGGRDLDLLHAWAEGGLRLLRHPANRAALAALPDRRRLVITLEQYHLAAVIEHRRAPVAHLFDDWADALRPGRAEAAGYTHLIAGAKRGWGVRRRLARRLRWENPTRYARLRGLLAGREPVSRAHALVA